MTYRHLEPKSKTNRTRRYVALVLLLALALVGVLIYSKPAFVYPNVAVSGMITWTPNGYDQMFNTTSGVITNGTLTLHFYQGAASDIEVLLLPNEASTCSPTSTCSYTTVLPNGQSFHVSLDYQVAYHGQVWWLDADCTYAGNDLTLNVFGSSYTHDITCIG